MRWMYLFTCCGPGLFNGSKRWQSTPKKKSCYHFHYLLCAWQTHCCKDVEAVCKVDFKRGQRVQLASAIVSCCSGMQKGSYMNYTSCIHTNYCLLLFGFHGASCCSLSTIYSNYSFHTTIRLQNVSWCFLVFFQVWTQLSWIPQGPLSSRYLSQTTPWCESPRTKHGLLDPRHLIFSSDLVLAHGAGIAGKRRRVVAVTRTTLAFTRALDWNACQVALRLAGKASKKMKQGPTVIFESAAKATENANFLHALSSGFYNIDQRQVKSLPNHSGCSVLAAYYKPRHYEFN